MPKLDEIKARLDWLKEQFKILVAVLVADVAGLSKLYLDGAVGVLFYSGLVLLGILTIAGVIVSRKIELHLAELRDICHDDSIADFRVGCGQHFLSLSSDYDPLAS
ncbi:hypothetical protein [Candidatus Contendibacter odensensis]|uniref:Uncharacterized protein n=1 Tax=Candidatus Contendobacter odensis Run_B_J11 TaxID=1400861 RepID=A0A7U7GD46_9GAMM|nr:hypothetical protein [Candidatus Contendobacter odensis]CDH45584.1 hypothetical protein BN874_2640001 [Candidatus Contendobacter odensis Run_B_J11]